MLHLLSSNPAGCLFDTAAATDQSNWAITGGRQMAGVLSNTWSDWMKETLQPKPVFTTSA